MHIHDENDNVIGEVTVVKEDGHFEGRIFATPGIGERAISGRVDTGRSTVIRPSSVHHPRCNMNCTGDTHYLTSLEVQ